jgi:hypothetical protein
MPGLRRGLATIAAAAAAAAATAGAGTIPVAAASCPALDYQGTLAAAATALHQAPPDVSTAQRDVQALQAADASTSVALAPVAADLAAVPAQLADAEARLDSMSATLAYPPHSTCHDNAAAARSTLHDVYASPSFRHLDDSSQTGILDAILGFFSTLFGRAAGALGAAGAVLAAALVLALAAVVAWRRWHGTAAARGAVIDEPATAGDDPDQEWGAAERAAARGDHREAVRRAFRAALIDVGARGHVHLDSAWTTREVLAHCSADGQVLAALAAAAAVFDRAWYSATPVSRRDWEVAAERCTLVRTLARHAHVPSP